ncbi:Leukemia inhibitory factor receptor [Liparis tanakae]|uniref:Leukemia inhibitory factor receptor n=1 Tax=Liparis tanakae TaxID=230148 RepID=A0A4Z2H6W6_9TELE|nr:Leukemia inhibitory factor receptor [Liparis tanakae]
MIRVEKFFFQLARRSSVKTSAKIDIAIKGVDDDASGLKSARRHSGRLVVNVSWPQEDIRFIKYYSNATQCSVEHLNASLSYTAQIQCVTTSPKCPQCALSEAYTVPPELTTRPLIVNFKETDIRGRDGCRLLSLTWKFPGKEPHDGYAVSVRKASGEAARERISTAQPQITLILSYSAYRLDIRAVNSASSSPAMSREIPRREDLHEPLEPYTRYDITLHTRPDTDTCNMKRVNDSESTYGRTQFYSAEGSPVGAPTNISSDDVTLNSAALQWSSIPEDEVRGFLLGYIIYYKEYHQQQQQGRPSTERNVTVDPTLNRYELRRLAGGTAYEVQMAGLTRAGAGVRSAASLFKTKDHGFPNLVGLIIISAAVAAVLIFGSPIIKRAKGTLWPSVPSPGKSDAMQRIEEPCDPELLEALDTRMRSEWDTSGLRVAEEEDAIPSRTPTSTVPLLGEEEEEEEEEPETTRNRIQRDPEDETGDVGAHGTEETLPGPQSSPLAVSGDYTTLDAFQRGMPATPSGTRTAQRKPEEPDSTGATAGLDYIGKYGTSPVSNSKMFTML